MVQTPSPPQTENRERKEGETQREAEGCQRRRKKDETEIVVLRGKLLGREQAVLPETQEEPRARPTVVGNREQENSRRKDNNTKRQGRQMLLQNHRKGCKPQRTRGRAEEACRCQAIRVNGLNNLLIF